MLLGMTRSAFTFALAAAALAATPASALAAERYVKKTGSNASNTCLVESAPCLTVQHAVNNSANGDVINVGPGEYVEQVSAAAVNVVIRGAGAGPAGTPNPAFHTIIHPASSFGVRMFEGGGLEKLRVEGGNGASAGPALIAGASGPGPAVGYALREVVLIGGKTASQGGSAISQNAGGTGRTVSVLVYDSELAASSPSTVSDVDAVEAAGPDVNFGALRTEIRGGLGDADTGVDLASATGILLDVRLGTDVSLDRGVVVRGVNGAVLVARSRIGSALGIGLESSAVGEKATAVLRDSLVGPVSPAVGIPIRGVAASGGVLSLDVRQSTLFARGPTLSTAVGLAASGGATATGEFHNSVVHYFTPSGSTYDLAAIAGSGAEAKISATHSLYNRALAAGAGTVTTPGTGTNVTGDPQFVDPLTMNYQLKPSSPAIDRGNAALLAPSELDLLGAARNVDGNGDCRAAPDLGAYELQGHAAGCPVAPQPPAAATPQLPALLQSLAPPRPRVSNLRLRRDRRGIRATFALSQAAPVVLTLFRELPGLRRGRTCAKPSKALKRRRARRCKRLQRLASTRAQGRAGANTMTLNRRVRRGTYRVTLGAAGALAPAVATLTVR
jgi:hypothetical protein